MSESELPAGLGFTSVGTGLGDEREDDVNVISSDRLRPEDALALTNRLEDIASARLRARAASRTQFVG